MEITALSSVLSQSELVTKASAAVLDMNLDQIEEMGDAMAKMMEQSVYPHLGQSVDVRV